MLEFHQAVVSTLREADEAYVPLDPAPALPPNIAPTNPLMVHTTEDMQRLQLQECEIDMLRFGADQHDENSADNGKHG